MIKESKIKTKDGFILDVLEHIPDNPKSYLVMCHGMMEDKYGKNNNLYQLASILSEKLNIHVIQFDFRGHGKSSGTSLDVNLESFYIDIDTVITNYVKDKEVSLFGFSFGGFTVTEYLYKKRIKDIDKVMLISAPIDPYNCLLNYKEGFINSYYINKENIIKNKGYIEFENGWRPSEQFFKGIEEYDYETALKYIPKSTLFLISNNDDAVSPKKNIEYAKLLGYRYLTFNSSHSLSSVFNEVISLALNYYK